MNNENIFDLSKDKLLTFLIDKNIRKLKKLEKIGNSFKPDTLEKTAIIPTSHFYFMCFKNIQDEIS